MYRLPLLPRWIRYLALVSVAIVIVTFSIVPLPRWVTSFGPLGLLPIRQYLHLIAYAGFTIVLGYAVADIDRPDWQILGGVFVVTVAFGGAMEALQLTLPHRTASVRDLVMNAAGAAVAVGVWRVLFPRVQDP